jgi:photosystem II stability/assembly factor-like uncharacterized protein
MPLRVAITLLALAALTGFGPSGSSPKVRRVALRYLQMVDAERGYALAGEGDTYRVLATEDGGGIWRDVTPGAGTYRATAPLTIKASLLLFSTRAGKGVFAVERSTDGGRGWQQSRSFRDSFGSPAPGSPVVVDARHLYLAVNEGAAAGSSSQALFRSSDGGTNWQFVSRTGSNSPSSKQLPFGCDKSGFGFASVTSGFAGGYCAGGAPFLYRTLDGGHSWQHVTLPAPRVCACETTAPTFFSRRVGALALYGFAANGNGKPFAQIFWTSDAGNHWRGSGPTAGRVMPPVIVSPRVVWLVSQLPGNLRAPFDQLWRTADSGASWIPTKLPFDGQAYQLDPLSARTAFALSATSSTRSILLTKDGGRTWRAIKTYVVA